MKLNERILYFLSLSFNPAPVGSLAMALGKSIPETEKALQDLVLEGLVRRANPPEVEPGVIAYCLYDRVASRVSTPRVIGLDFDGVLGDFVTPCCKVMSEVTGRAFIPEDQTDWDLFYLLNDEERAKVFKVIESPGWCDNILPYPGAVEAVRELQTLGHTLICITAPWTSPTWEFERKACLRRHFGDIPMISTHVKEYVSCDILVEDRISNLEKWVGRQRGRGLLFAQPYNKKYPASKMTRITSLTEVKNFC